MVPGRMRLTSLRSSMCPSTSVRYLRFAVIQNRRAQQRSDCGAYCVEPISNEIGFHAHQLFVKDRFCRKTIVIQLTSTVGAHQAVLSNLVGRCFAGNCPASAAYIASPICPASASM